MKGWKMHNCVEDSK